MSIKVLLKELCCADIIRVIIILEENSMAKVIGRFAVFKDRDNEPVIYYLFAPGGEEGVRLLPMTHRMKKKFSNTWIV